MLNLKKLATKVRLSQNEKGQGLVEYALILVMVAVVVIAVLLLAGPAVSDVYCKVTDALQPGSCAGGGVRTDGPHQLHITPGLTPEYRCNALGLSGGEKWYEWLEGPAPAGVGAGMVFSTSGTEPPGPNYYLNGSAPCP